MYQVYQIRRNVSGSLNYICLDPKRKVKCYNIYFINEYVFQTEECGQGRKTNNSGVCVKGSTSNKVEVDFYGKLEEVIELQYHTEHK